MKSLDELEKLRASGIPIAPEEEIAAKRAARAQKKARQVEEKELKKVFPSRKETIELLWQLRNKVRDFRKDAVEKGITKVNLPEEWKEVIALAFEKLDHDVYHDVLWSLITECLKVQDRKVKRLAFNTADRWISEGKVDFGWLLCMLNRRYVSRYGWELLRKHAETLAPIGHYVLKSSFDYWAKDPATWEKWNRLASEDGLPADIRELYARYAVVRK